MSSARQGSEVLVKVGCVYKLGLVRCIPDLQFIKVFLCFKKIPSFTKLSSCDKAWYDVRVL